MTAELENPAPGERRWLWFLSGSLLPLGAYLLTLAPSLASLADSGEMTTAAVTLGIPHPPGYPLFALLGHLFSWLPWGEPAWRINLMAAVCVALASGLLTLTGGLLSGSWRAGLGAALLWAFAVTPWRLATGAEVFSLHLALLSATLWAAVEARRAQEAQRSRWMALLALCLGADLANHLTIVLVLPGLVAWLWPRAERRPLGPSLLAWAALLPGLLCYLYLPWRAASHPPLAWGDPQTLERFVAVVTRQGYGSLRLSTYNGGSASFHLVAYARSLAVEQFPWALVLLGGVGLVAGWRTRRRETGLALLVTLCFGPLFVWLSPQPPDPIFVDVMERFYASSYLGFALLVAVGMAALERRFVLLGWVWVVLPVLSLGLHLVPCNRAGNYLAYDTARAMLEAVPPQGALIANSDLTAGSALYVQCVEHRRPDVQLIFPGLLHSPWYLETLPEPQAQAARSHPEAPLDALLATLGDRACIDVLPPGLKGSWTPLGLLLRSTPSSVSQADQGRWVRQGLEQLQVRPPRGRTSGTFWDRALLGLWSTAYRRAGEVTLAREPEQAQTILEQALTLLPDDALTLTLLARCRMRLGKATAAEDSLIQSLQLDAAQAPAWALMGQLRVDQRRLPEAEEAIRRSLKLDPAQPRLWVALAQLRSVAGHPDEAIQVLEEGLALAPGAKEVRAALLGLYAQSGRLQDVRRLQEATPSP